MLSKDSSEYLKDYQKQFMPEDADAGMILAFLDDFKGDRVCSKLLWKEALHRDYEPKRIELKQICDIMNNSVTDWVMSDGAMHFGDYGKQRGCGRVGKEGEFQKINYGIRMGKRYEGQNIYDSLDFTVSHHTGKVQFDENGHAAQPGGNSGLVPLTSSTLLSIEAGSYISGAPTCLILAEVTHNSGSEGGPTVFTPVRMTAGFSVAPSYDASSGLNLTIHDDRDNIADVFNPNNYEHIPAIIEVQAIYTHSNAQSETVPAQQMHTYIGEWTTISAEGDHGHPGCSFLCNKIEEWMTAIDLTDTSTDPDNFTGGVGLYVVIRVY